MVDYRQRAIPARVPASVARKSSHGAHVRRRTRAGSSGGCDCGGGLENGKWAATFNVTSSGAFDIALSVTTPGRSMLALASCVTGGSLVTDLDVNEIGCAPPASGHDEMTAERPAG